MIDISMVSLKGLKVNLIMTDYSMPGMTGYELLKKIKVWYLPFDKLPLVGLLGCWENPWKEIQSGSSILWFFFFNSKKSKALLILSLSWGFDFPLSQTMETFKILTSFPTFSQHPKGRQELKTQIYLSVIGLIPYLKSKQESKAFRKIPVVIMSSENILTRIDRYPGIWICNLFALMKVSVSSNLKQKQALNEL